MENFEDKMEKEKVKQVKLGKSVEEIQKECVVPPTLEERRTIALEQIASSANSLVLLCLIGQVLESKLLHCAGHVDCLLCDGRPHLCHHCQEDHLITGHGQLPA